MCKIKMALALTLFHGLSCQAVADTSDGLLVYLPFDEDYLDYSGNGNHGTASGTIDFVEGIAGKAAEFDGNSSVQIGHPINFNHPFSTNFWVKTNSTKHSAGIITQHHACGGAVGNFYVVMYGPGSGYEGELQFQTLDSNRMDTPSSQIIDGEWHNVSSVAYNGVMELYIDGELAVNDETYSSSLNFSDVTLAVGGFFSNSCPINHDFIGLIDEVRIYNRSLTEAEIEELYSSSMDPKPEISVNGGFIKMDITRGNHPDARDCSHQDHYGRAVIDDAADVLYICTQVGWSAH